MGVSGLSAYVRKKCPQAVRKVSAVTFRNSRVAIDTSILAHKYINSVHGMCLEMESIDDNKRYCLWFTRYVELISDFITYGITPIFVFDGKAPKEKAQTKEDRQEKKEELALKLKEAKQKWFETPIQERTTEQLLELQACLKKSVTLPSFYLKQLYKSLESCGIPVLQAVGEADSLCASLALEGLVSAVYSTDSDLLLHGVRDLIVDWKPDHSEKVIMLEVFNLPTLLQETTLSLTELIAVGCLSGTDYNKGIDDVSITTAIGILMKNNRGLPESVNDIPFSHLREMFSYIPTEDQIVQGNGINIEVDLFKRNAESMLISRSFQGQKWKDMLWKIDSLPQPGYDVVSNFVK
jgi:flap endonuclease-1